MFLLSSGEVAYVGAVEIFSPSSEWRKLRTFDPVLPGWTTYDAAIRAHDTMNACMFQKDRILTAGAAYKGLPANWCELLDFRTDPPSVTTLDNMPTARDHLVMIPLPDGKVICLGGPAHTRPDLFDPYDGPNGSWKSNGLAPTSIAREYHSSGVLCPDGSVFLAGGEYPAEPPDYPVACQRSWQIYKPTYFFAPVERPVITSAPTFLQYGQAYDVLTPDASGITKARLIRLGAQTHSYDQDARSLELRFIASIPDPNGIRIRMPSNPNEAPPGFYYLFIAKGMNGSLPSLGKIVRVGY